MKYAMYSDTSRSVENRKPNQSKNSKEGLLLFLYSSILYVERKEHSLRSPSLNPLLANELLLVLIILAKSIP